MEKNKERGVPREMKMLETMNDSENAPSLLLRSVWSAMMAFQDERADASAKPPIADAISQRATLSVKAKMRIIGASKRFPAMRNHFLPLRSESSPSGTPERTMTMHWMPIITPMR